MLAVGRLDSLSALLPDTGLFLYTYVRKEAVLSSQIEGASEITGRKRNRLFGYSRYISILSQGTE